MLTLKHEKQTVYINFTAKEKLDNVIFDRIFERFNTKYMYDRKKFTFKKLMSLTFCKSDGVDSYNFNFYLMSKSNFV